MLAGDSIESLLMVATISTVCEHCQGSGWIPVEGALQVRACSCQPELRKRQRLGAAAIPKRYYHCTLQNFNTRGSMSLTGGRRQIAEFIDCWPAKGPGLLLMGGCGVGKTHLAVAILQEVIISGKPGKLLFSNFQDLIQEIQASFSSDQAPSKSEILRPLIEADLLVLDELGSQKPTTFVQEILYHLINSRYNDEKSTVFTTNYFDESPDVREETLEQRIGKRLRSRLHEMTDRVRIDADDYRKSKSRMI